MKRKSLSLKRLPLDRLAIIVILMSSMSSCSWLSERQALFDAEEKAKNDPPMQMVPKSQYDQLLQKYDSLVKKVNDAEGMKKQSVERPFQGQDPSNLVNELSKVEPPTDLAETVDVFDSSNMRGANEAMLPVMAGGAAALSGNQIEAQIIALKKGIMLVEQNRFDQALGVMKDLEKSPVKQIQVRAKFYIAEMLFVQKEYDLAMQIFEEVIHKYAYSGLVIKTLGRLIVCTEKLKLNKKRDKYYSILHDFFEVS